MKALTKLATGAAAAALLTAAAATPAQAQYYPYERDRGASAGEIIAGVAAVAGVAAAVSAAAQGRYYDPRYGYDRYGYGYGRGFERHAIDACRYEADRRYARRGATRFDVRDVQQFRDRIRILGSVEIRDNRRYDPRWGRGYDPRWDRGGWGQRVAVSCEVRGDGRVTRFRTHNYNW
jgi:hypothetical protein